MGQNDPNYRPVPVESARQIAEACSKDIVIIFAVDIIHDTSHVTTYGRHPSLKDFAAVLGVKVAAAMEMDGGQAKHFEDFRATPQAEAAATIDRLTRELAEAREQVEQLQRRL